MRSKTPTGTPGTPGTRTAAPPPRLSRPTRRRVRSESPIGRSLLVALLATALAVGLLPLPGGASELDEGEAASFLDDAEIRLLDPHERLPLPEGASGRGMWIWQEGRRGFFIRGNPWDIRAYGHELMAVELDTGEVVGSVALSPPAWRTHVGDATELAFGREHTVAVDQDRGRLFVPYGIPGRITDDETGPATNAARGQACAHTSALAALYSTECVGGVHVIDGQGMEVVRTIDLQPALDAPYGFAPMLRALRYTPPSPGEEGEGKVHLLVELYAHHVALGIGADENTRGSFQQLNLHYAIQLDVASGRQDWAVRAGACRATRDETDNLARARATSRLPYPAGIYRSLFEPALWVACNTSRSRAAVMVRIPLDGRGRPYGEAPVALGDPATAGRALAEENPDALAGRAPAQESWVGPEGALEFRVDPASGRTVIRANVSRSELWWVFDERERAYIGGIGVGAYRRNEVQGALDERTGRLYVSAESPPGTRTGVPGGLYVADIRRTPLPQALHFPHLVSQEQARDIGIALLSVGPDEPVRLYRGRRLGPNATADVRQDCCTEYEVIEDRLPLSSDGGEAEYLGATLDLDEQDGVTAATFDGAARGFALRAILVGGVAGATRTGTVDADAVWGRFMELPITGDPIRGALGGDPVEECGRTHREVVVGFVGPDSPASVDGGGSRGSAQPLVLGGQTDQDLRTPATRCTSVQWREAWGPFAQPPVDEPGAPEDFTQPDSRSSCVSDDDNPSDDWHDPFLGGFQSHVACSEAEAGGGAAARGIDLDNLSVSEAISRFHIYRDPDRGLVSRVESIVRGVDIGGVIKIDTIRGTAESWANGRRNRSGDPALERALGLSPENDRETGEEVVVEDGNPHDCDISRTAGTCFTRHVFGVHINDGSGGTAYECGPCGDEQALETALNAALGTSGQARLRQPDRALARGADNGYIAAVQKPDSERFADLTLNSDLLDTTLPSLEIIRYAPGSTPVQEAYVVPPARQIYQFAGVEVSSTYSIQCLLEYDAVTNVCAESLPDPASLSVELIDLDGAALSGGAFELRRDTDGDGVLGLVDELVEGGACATGPEGVCSFDGLEPGAYLVSQTAAPDGYAPVDEPLAVSLFGGDDLTVTFTNVPNFSTITLTVADLDGAPVEGAVFGVYPDADYVAASASASPGGVEPVATCVTDADGVCSMTVPPGAYVLRQLSAPDGLLPIDDIAFVISQAGQTADVALTLGATGTDPAPVTEPAAGPVDDFAPAPVPLAQPAVSIAPAPARPAPSVTTTPPAISAPPPAVAEQVGGTIIRVIRSPAGALRLAARSPVEAASLVMVLLLVGLAVMAVARRQQLATLLAEPGPTRGGAGPSASRGGPGGTPPPSGPSGGPGSGAAASAGVHTATAVLERPQARPARTAVPPVVAGAAPSPTEGKTATVVVATAHPALAALASQRLDASHGTDLRATASDLDELRDALTAHSPDVLVVDLALPAATDQDHQDDGADLCAALAGLHPPDRTVGLIPPGAPAHQLIAAGQTAGLAGLLAADDDLGNGHLAYAVRQVAVGKRCHGPTVQTLLHDDTGPAAGPGREPAPYLTERELEVARLAAQGRRREIAKTLFISENTARVHLQRIRKKLDLQHSRDHRELRRRLKEFGLLEDDS